MFGRQQMGGSSGGSGNLVEFRAGRMNMIGKMVHPDTRKGLVYMTQGEDGLMHFCWKDRTTGKVEDDLIVFPDDFEFKRVEQCKTGRVYVLKFKTSSRRMFFWMQEPKPEKDDEFCRRVNELMNNPPSTQRNGGDGNDLQYMLNNMSQQQLMQLFGGVGQMGGLSSLLGSMNRSESSLIRTPSSNRNQTGSGGSANTLLTPETNNSAPRTPGAPKGKRANGNEGGNNAGGNGNTDNGKTQQNPYSNIDFNSYLSNLSPEAGSGRSLNIDLTAAIASSDRINDVLSDPECTNKLSVHLPESLDNDENKKQQIKDTIASPQFQQALSLFSNALQSAQLGPVVSQFELTSDAVAAAYSGNLEDFIKALNKSLPAGSAILSPTTKEKEDVKMEEGDDKTPAEKKE